MIMKKYYIAIGALLFVLLSVLGLNAVLRWNGNYAEERLLAQDDYAQIRHGVITGSLSYPSDFMPNLEICAVDIKTNESYCTYQMIQGPDFTYGYGYRLEVPAGNYQVYSKINDQFEDYKAYYSEFVKCGGEYTCTNHAPITIQVSADETVRKIDPVDWYASQ